MCCASAYVLLGHVVFPTVSKEGLFIGCLKTKFGSVDFSRERHRQGRDAGRVVREAEIILILITLIIMLVLIMLLRTIADMRLAMTSPEMGTTQFVACVLEEAVAVAVGCQNRLKRKMFSAA